MKKKGFPIYWLLRTRVLLVSDCSDLLVAEKINIMQTFFFIRPHNGP